MSAPTLSVTPPSLADLWAALTVRGEPAEIVRLDVDGCRMDVVTNEPKLRERLERYFGTWIRTDAGSADLRIAALERLTLDLNVAGSGWTSAGRDLEVGDGDLAHLDLPDGRLVRSSRTGMVFGFGGDLHLAAGRCLRNGDQLVRFVNDRYARWRISRGYLPAHAGGVARNGRILALCGADGTGKSTTAVRLMTEGLDFVSHDRLLLRPSEYGVEVLGAPRHPRVNPGTILSIPALEGIISPTDRIRLKALPYAELVTLEHEYDVMVDHVRGAGRFATRGHLAALVVFNWDPDHGDPAARDVDLSIHPELLPLVMKSTGLLCDPGREDGIDLSPERYLDVLSRRPVVEIIGGRDFDAAVRLAREVLDRYAR